MLLATEKIFSVLSFLLSMSWLLLKFVRIKSAVFSVIESCLRGKRGEEDEGGEGGMEGKE